MAYAASSSCSQPSRDDPAPGRIFEGVEFFADLLLKLPERPILTAVLALCEREPLMLYWTWLSLDTKGLSPLDDFAKTLPKAERAKDCPILEQEEEEEEEKEDRRSRVCRKLPCGHAFHESCLGLWFRARTACPVCRQRPDPCRRRREPRKEEEEEEVGDGGSPQAERGKQKMDLESLKDEIRVYLFRHHPADAADWFHSDGVRRRQWVRSMGPFEFPKMLLQFPYRSSLKAVITLYEHQPTVLVGMFINLHDVGIPRDVASTLPETTRDRVRNCPILDPLHEKQQQQQQQQQQTGDAAVVVVEKEEEEVGRVLNCGHSFHETCLRYWLRVRKDCPACGQKVYWDEDMPPPLKGERYAKRNLDGMTIAEMQDELLKFLEVHHVHNFNCLMRDLTDDPSQHGDSLHRRQVLEELYRLKKTKL